MIIDTNNPIVVTRAIEDARNAIKNEYETALYSLMTSLKCTRKELLEFMQSTDGKQTLVDWVAEEQDVTANAL